MTEPQTKAGRGRYMVELLPLHRRVRVSFADGSPWFEGEVIGYHSEPTWLVVGTDGVERAVSTRLPIEVIERRRGWGAAAILEAIRTSSQQQLVRGADAEDLAEWIVTRVERGGNPPHDPSADGDGHGHDGEDHEPPPRWGA